MVDQNKVMSTKSAFTQKSGAMQVSAQEQEARAERSDGGFIAHAQHESNKFFNKEKKMKSDIHEMSVLSQNSDDGDAMLISTGADYQMHQRMVAREVDLLKRERDVERSSAKQLKSLRLDMQRKEEQIDIMQRKMNSLVKSKIDLMEDLELLKSKTNYEQAKLLQEMKQLKGMTDEQSKQDEESSSVILENQQLRNQIQQLQNQNNLLMVELDAANEQQTDPNEVTVLKHQIKDLENEKQILVVQLNAAREQEIAQQNNKQQLFSIQQGQNGNLATQKKVDELEEELVSEQATCVELREQLAQVREQLNGKVEKLEMQLQLQKMKYGQAQARLMEMDNKQGASSGTPSSSEKSPPSMKHIQELQSAEMRAAQAEQRAEQLSLEMKKKEEEMSASQKNLTSLRQNLLSMNNQVVQLSSQVKDLQSKVKSKTGQLEIALQQVAHISKKMQSSKIQLDNYKVQSLSLLGYLGTKIVQNQQVSQQEGSAESCDTGEHDEISLEQLPQQQAGMEEVVQNVGSECGSQSSLFKLKVYQQSSHSNILQSQSHSEDMIDLLRHEGCAQCAKCGHLISSSDLSVTYNNNNRAYSEPLQDSCQPITPQCSSYEISPALVSTPPLSTVSRTNSKQNVGLSLPDTDICTDTAQSPRRPEPTTHTPVAAEVKYAAPLISNRARAVLKILLGRQPWMVWIRRLLILSAAIFARRNANWFLQKFRQIYHS